jgi:hypothetical protein
MPTLKMLDTQIIDDLFQRPDGPGLVLDFSDRTFGMFFREELDANIDDPIYSREGTSKLRRLKCYLRTVVDTAAARALNALWKYREMCCKRRAGKSALPTLTASSFSSSNALAAKLKPPRHRNRQPSIARCIVSCMTR